MHITFVYNLCLIFVKIFSYSQYSIISEADRVITFGGHCHYQSPYELDEVTEYKNDEWTLLGIGFQGSSDQRSPPQSRRSLNLIIWNP